MAHDKSPCKGEKAYRILMTVDSDAIQNQYAEASVADYILEKVTISANWINRSEQYAQLII